MIFSYYLYLIKLSRQLEERVMRENFQWGLAVAANSLIYANDLFEAVMETVAFLMGVLL